MLEYISSLESTRLIYKKVATVVVVIVYRLYTLYVHKSLFATRDLVSVALAILVGMAAVALAGLPVLTAAATPQTEKSAT